MLLINCKISLILTWSKILSYFFATGATEFAITDTKLYVSVVILSTEDNVKLWTQLESDLKRTFIRINGHSKLTDQEQSKYFEYLINPSFQRVNRLFILLFENRTDRKVHIKYYIPKVEIKDYNVIIDGKKLFDQSIKNALNTYENIRKIATGQRDD